ncbi:hypothetical protein JXI42_08470 [bacterium]|nr:hypothetical protein [bacterium]
MLSLFWDTYSAYKELFGCEEFTECPDDEDIWVNTTECNLIEGCYGIIKGSLEARVHTPPDGYDNGVFPLGFLIGENSIRVCREYNNDNDNVLPIVTTAAVTSITQTTAVCGGTVTDSGSAEVNARGVCWSTSPSPNTLDEITTDSSGTGEFTSTLTGLTPSTPYYVRAYATNSEGTAYGNTRTFTTSGGGGCGTCVDIDGNSYATIQIGEQCWMAENLKVTHYRDGTVIPNVTAATEWSNLDDTETGAYCEYDNDPSNVPTYGRLYNWYAIDDARGLAPDGWHVSTDEEWKTLEIYLGMDPDTADIWGYRGTNEGSKLAGIADLWYDGDLEDDPEFGSSGFTALPGGYRSYGGTFLNMSYLAYFWSSSEYSTAYAWNRTLLFSSAVVYRLYYDKHYGFSVRCLRD